MISKGHVRGDEFNELKEGLEKAKEWVEKDVTIGFFGNTNGPISHLSDGLAAFIGYGSKGTFSDYSTTGRLTGAGIAPSNIATHRLCDAAIAFTIGVLEGVRQYGRIKNRNDLTAKIDGLIKKLYECYGKGTTGLEGVAQTVESQLNGGRGTWPGLDGFVTDFRESFTKNFKSSLSSEVSQMATKVGAYLKGVFKGTGGHNWDGRNGQGIDSKVIAIGTALNSKNVYNLSELNSHIGAVEGAIDTSRASNATVKPILEAGKKAFMAVLKMPNYTRMDYEAASSIQWNSDTAKVQTCAKIFLGCLPLYYQALTYIYWGCHVNGGRWGNQTLANGAMRSYFDSQGLLPLYVDKSKTGAHIAESALKGFQEFARAASSSLSTANSTYASFAKALQTKVGQNADNLSTNCPLSALFHCASCYFRYQQIKNAKSAVGAPKTIREMLYFLAALQFSSAYDEVEGHIGTAVPNDLSVADSSDGKPDNKLSAADLKEYLRASCAFSSSVLGMIQGPGASQNASDPWLFELFCNSAFQFKYPSSSSTLFNTLSSYAYALQFQLLFLYSMCANNVNKCGWQHCTYGKEINASGISVLQSHICQGLKCNGDTRCNHTKGSSQCNHNKYTETNSCGKSAATPSPLQAFLTDQLKGFSRGHPSDPSSHLASCSGSLCHVPMGFTADNLRSASNGNAQGAQYSLRPWLILRWVQNPSSRTL
ncbi:uncharacterized protein BcabD6B2_29360 [Babesia caballi]|uniref:Variant erythrocyte surface antigen-1, beta subunit n=1 Tax=Babesia caballi TaxID=5871 RepID=A0AAV4LUI9_BABCB|nr:hypothetical protein, conserved [Babesia caballi]